MHNWCFVPLCANGATPHATIPGCGVLPDFRSPSRKWEVGGMGPDAPVIVNEQGAGQSSIPFVFTTMPLRALLELARLQRQGDDKYGPGNWRGIPERDHIDHAIAHLVSHLVGDATDEHLLHATWRLLAALEAKIVDDHEIDRDGES